MMHLAAYGRLGADPKEIPTKTGKLMSVGNFAVNLLDRDGEEHTQWLGLLAFGKVAETLLKHSKGELLSISGRAQMNIYQSGGEKHEQIQVILNSIVSARSARPGGGRKKAAGKDSKPDESETSQKDFDDDIPF